MKVGFIEKKDYPVEIKFEMGTKVATMNVEPGFYIRFCAKCRIVCAISELCAAF